MLLFLVRHAYSDAPRNRWQHPNSKLSKIGKEQAEILGEKSRFAKVDNVFSSKWDRSKETAEIISSKLNVNLETLNYIHEREQSPEIYGSPRDSAISKEYAKEYYNNYKNLDWKFRKEEESIREVIERVSRFSEFLVNNHKDKQILTISHDIFIRCFISLALLGKNYDDKTMIKIISSLSINYTGISLLIYNGQRNNWKVSYINDYSHLKFSSKKRS